MLYALALLIAAATPAEVAAAAPADAWRPIIPENLLLIDLAGGKRVTIELAPDFAPVHVPAVRALARAHWWDGTSINRVQDDYVVQWGDASGNKPLPPEVLPHPIADYERPVAGLALKLMPYRDAYARDIGFADGWPVASDDARAWLPHCYAMVGVGRDTPPDTGSGAELYAVIGQAPRQLDRNIALVGRVIDGIEAMSALPRGGAAMGFYTTAAERTAIVRVRLASDLPPAERPRWQVMRTDSNAFADYVLARANRGDGFFVKAAGAVDLCNAPVPVRRAR